MSSRSTLIAGASGGMGSAIARELASRGDALTLVARDRSRLDALEVEGHRLALDLREPEACERAVAEAREAHGRLDVVVNAAGVVAFGPIDELDPDTLDELLRINTFMPMMLARAAVPAMDEGGVIVNLTGIVAEKNFPNMAAYGASKAAVRSFDEVLARETRPRKIRVLDARPPHTETGLAERPIAGTAPKLPPGLDPARVAARICDAIDGDDTDLPSDAFGRLTLGGPN
jgi:cyclic-di-GMP-binding biofilm dispersal mediator protein